MVLAIVVFSRESFIIRHISSIGAAHELSECGAKVVRYSLETRVQEWATLPESDPAFALVTAMDPLTVHRPLREFQTVCRA